MCRSHLGGDSDNNPLTATQRNFLQTAIMQLVAKSLIPISFFVFIVGCSQKAEIEKRSFWDTQRRGSNGDANDGLLEYFQVAEEFGIEMIRLSPADMKSESKDFLIGDIDDYHEIPEKDLQRFIAVLNNAAETQVKVVITFFGLPGARWRQHNAMEFDYRLWEDFKYHEQSARFWADLARELKDHPAVVGYNILNEPHPERKDGFQSGQTDGFDDWLRENHDTPASLNLFYQRVIDAIREVDTETPIILDARFHASPDGFDYFEPLEGDGLFYSCHFYSPWSYTTHRENKERFSYPEHMPQAGSEDTGYWGKEDMSALFDPVRHWLDRYNIPKEKLIVAEIGCDRRVGGATQYLKDLIHTMNHENWHWGFYSFRSASWDGMDYELGSEKLNWKHWQAIEAGKSHNEIVNRHENPLWNVVLNGLKRETP